MKATQVVVDAFAGVGPFVVPAARRGVTCFANDLNPESTKWLAHNAASNKVPRTALACVETMDAREFIRLVFVLK